jgi:hypothetical protein
MLSETKGISLTRLNINNNGLLPSSWISSCYLPLPEPVNNKQCSNITVNNYGSPGNLAESPSISPPNNQQWIHVNKPIFSYSNSLEFPIISFNKNFQITQFQALIYTLTGKFISYIVPLQWVDPFNPLPLQNIAKLNLPPGNYILYAQASDSQFRNYHKKNIITILP